MCNKNIAEILIQFSHSFACAQWMAFKVQSHMCAAKKASTPNVRKKEDTFSCI